MKRSKAIAAVEAELRKVSNEIDAAYWAFTRQARGKLAPAATYRRRHELWTALAALKGTRPASDPEHGPTPGTTPPR